MLSNEELKQQAFEYGWEKILSHFGIDSACLDSRKNKRSHCPLCGGDTHSNHFDYRNNSIDETYHCFKCGGGDGFKLLYQFNKTGFGDIAKLIKGDTSRPVNKPISNHPQSEKTDTKAKIKKLERYKKAIKYSGHTPKTWGLEYLRGRGIKFKNPQRKLDFIRYGSGYYNDRFIPDSKGKPSYHNCLIFPLSQFGTGVTGVVRIYTDMQKVETVLKAMGEDVRELIAKPMLSVKPLSGSGVWFTKAPSPVLHVAEGIENTLSVLQALKTLSGVASVTAGLMGKLIIPSHITEVHVWNDSGKEGVNGAMELQERYDDQADVILHTPKRGRGDWNDILVNEGEKAIQEEFNSIKV